MDYTPEQMRRKARKFDRKMRQTHIICGVCAKKCPPMPVDLVGRFDRMEWERLWLMSSVDLLENICNECSEAFDLWCAVSERTILDTVRHLTYRDFISDRRDYLTYWGN